MFNPNILYLQTTPMTELPLIAFSNHFHLLLYRFIKNNMILTALLCRLFGFCAALSRYDGWFLILFEGLIIFIIFFPLKIVPWKD